MIKNTMDLITEVENVYKVSHTATDGEFISEFHSHDLWEVFVYLDGGVTYYVEDKVYDLILGDVLLIPPSKMHKSVLNNSSAQPYERIVLSISSNYIEDYIRSSGTIGEVLKQYRHSNNFLLNYKGESLSFLQGLLSRINKDDLGYEYKMSMLNSLMFTLVEGVINRQSDVGQQKDRLISNIIQYINVHYTEPLSLDKICTEFYVSKFYVNRRFKEYTGLTIYDYILSKRIGLARRLIRSGATANEAADRCGFGDYSTFYRAFTAKTGFTPKAYKSSPEQ